MEEAASLTWDGSPKSIATVLHLRFGSHVERKACGQTGWYTKKLHDQLMIVFQWLVLFEEVPVEIYNRR
jgi:hypothetical protein